MTVEKILRFCSISIVVLAGIFFIYERFKDDPQKLRNDLKSSNAAVRKEAAYSLGKLKSKDAVLDLMKLLQEEQAGEVKEVIIEALIEINDERALASMVKLINDPDRQVVIKVIDAIGDLGSQEGEALLVRALKTEDREIKLTVIRALGNIGGDAAVKDLTALAEHEDKFIKYNAFQALKQIGKQE